MDTRNVYYRFANSGCSIVFATALSATAYCEHQFQTHWDAAAKTYDAQRADALVVFAGGYKRIRAALEDVRGEQVIMISGGHPQSNLRHTFGVLSIQANDVAVQESGIHLLSNALNTQGNALETVQWLRANPQIQSIVVYTSANHVPRAHLELSRVLPEDITVRFHPVQNGNGSWDAFEERLKVTCKSIALCDWATQTQPLRQPYDLEANVNKQPLELTKR